MLLQMHNMNQKKDPSQSGMYFKKNFGTVQGQRWHTMTVNIMDGLTAYFNPGRYPIKHLDMFNGVWFYAGKPGSKVDFLIDDIEIYKKIYR